MDLAQAANYFARTAIDGWNGTTWVSHVAEVALLPFDRFISERTFGNNRRHILVPYENTAYAAYPVIRFPDRHIYLVGFENHDVFVDPYSRIILLHRAPYVGTLYQFTKTTAASGVGRTMARAPMGTFWCNVDRTTLANSQEFESVSLTQSTILLPRNCPIDTEHEMAIDGDYYDIKETNKTAGFIECRAVKKRSS